MTFLEVLDDAVKIGLGGLIGWFISKGARSHEFEKERRRRKQDCLEGLVEDLDEAESSLQDLSIGVAVQVESMHEDDAAAQTRAMRLTNERHDANTAAMTKLYRSRSKLIVFGFVACANALEAYEREALKYRVLLNEMRGGGKKSVDDEVSANRNVINRGDDLRGAVTEAFKTL
jgi:hypothetical protein